MVQLRAQLLSVQVIWSSCVRQQNYFLTVDAIRRAKLRSSFCFSHEVLALFLNIRDILSSSALYFVFNERCDNLNQLVITEWLTADEFNALVRALREEVGTFVNDDWRSIFER